MIPAFKAFYALFVDQDCRSSFQGYTRILNTHEDFTAYLFSLASSKVYCIQPIMCSREYCLPKNLDTF